MRRPFYELQAGDTPAPIASEALARIAALYAVETACRGQSAEQRRHLRQLRSKPILEVACWAHARRYFFDLARLTKAPIGLEAVARIDPLFAIEREING